MCVCMAVESVEVNGNSDLIGKESRKKGEIFKVYTRKNRKAKLLDASGEEPSISANGESSPSSSPVKNQSCRDDDVKNPARGDVLAGQDRNISEQQPLDAGLKGKGSSLDIGKVHNESGGGEEYVADVLGEKLPSIVKAVEDRTLISRRDEAGQQLYGSCQSEKCDEHVPNSNPEDEPQLDSSGRQEPSAGEVLMGNFLERQPTGGGEPVVDCRLELLSNDDQETNPIHGIEPRSGKALESSGRDELQPSSCKAHVSNNTEDLRQLPNGRGELPPSGGQLRLSNGAPRPHPCGQENHQVLDNLESGLSKPLVSMGEDRVFIALSELSSKDEMQSLKRKLEIELDQVRRVARKVDEKELQVSAYNARNMTNPAGFIGSVPGNSSVYNQPHLTRVSSSVDSFGHPETRSFRHLSVPVMENNHEVAELVEKEKSTPSVFYQPHLNRVNSSLCSVGHPETRPFRNSSVSVMENNHEAGEFVDREKRTPKANPYYTNSEFYLEKDRLPPESHKKMPKVPGAGKKHGFGGEYGVAFGFGADKDGNKLFKDCSNLLQRLMKHKHGWVFNSPVDPIKLGILDYNDIIKHPMDLGTIKTRLAQNRYKSAVEFAENVRLVFNNAMTYNPKGHEVHTMAEELSTIFEDRWASIEKGYFQKKMYNKAGYFPGKRKDYAPPSLLNPVTIPAPAQFTPPMRTLDRSVVRPANCNIPRVGRTPAPKKPKANDLNKRDMTFDEKQKLSTNLQSLPMDKLDAIVQIIKKRSTALSQHDDEIEVDIDNVDAETLWELDRFVSNFKKSLSKYRRKAELAAQQARDAAAQAIHKTDPVPAALVSQKESTIGGGKVNSAPIQVESHANGSASSSSSSSSSDSGSSSSDSDSDSSSADGLDAGHSPGA